MAVAYPTDFQVLDLAGLSLFALDRYPEAAEYLERANQAQPSDLETLDMLGKAYLRMKDYKALTSVFARIMQLSPNSASAHIMMGTAYDQMSNREEAIKEYQAAVAADPNFMGVHSGLGFQYWREGRERTCGERVPRRIAALSQRSGFELHSWSDPSDKSQPAEAEPHFRAAIAANPRYTEALFFLGRTELALNHPRAAVETLRKAIPIDPNYFQAHYVLGTVSASAGQTAEAKKEQKLSVDIQEKIEDRSNQED